MRFAKYSLTSQGTAGVTSTPWVPFNQLEDTFAVGFGVAVSGASGGSTVVYRVEHTFTQDASAVFTHEDVSAESNSKDGNYAFPIFAARATIVSGNDLTSKITFYVRQSGT